MTEAHTHSSPHSHEHSASCAHEAEHAARASEAMAEAQSYCDENGLRLTPIRRDVLGALYSTHRPMSAYEIIDRLAVDGGKRQAPVTIYRAMDFLVGVGFAHKLESRNAFIACPFHHRSGDLVVFMICERCGGVDEAMSEPLTRALSEIAERNHFAPRARVIELQGACAHCRDEDKANHE